MKIGIVTHYYKSKNYGGNLQAYALCKAIERFGIKVEQLCVFSENKKADKVPIQKKKCTLRDVKIAFHIFAYKTLTLNRSRNAGKLIHRRRNAILFFNQKIVPHSIDCYTEANIEESVKKYDAFITGSDMVWNPDSFSSIFILDFVPDETPKFSYAPSLGVSELNDNEREVFHNFLKTYQDVSVREQNAVSLLNELSPVPVEWVLDPTLLLEREEWDEIGSGRIIEEPYLFCYFLGSNTGSRKAAQDYARKHNLKLVTIPYLLGTYRSCDWKFGDVQLSDISPADFISLICYSEVVFTDSFHACVFSFLYHRDMYAFRRDAEDKWGSRIQSFLELLDCLPQYCNTDEKEHLEYIESLPKIDYSVPFQELERMKKSSMEYLQRNLKLAEEKIKNNEKKC